MKKHFLVFLILSLGLLLSGCVGTYTAKDTVSLFDGKVFAQRTAADGFHDNSVTFVFTETGHYDISFFKTEDTLDLNKHLLPNFSITVDKVPFIYTAYQYDITTQRVSITRDGVTNSQFLP